MWDLPGPGLEPVFPAFAGGFLTTAPPGKPSEPSESSLLNRFVIHHVVACISNSFLFMTEYYFIVSMYHSLPIVDGHLGCS